MLSIYYLKSLGTALIDLKILYLVWKLIFYCFRVRPGFITYAGTKDKRAKTSQRLCMRNMKPSQIFKASKSIRGVNLGDFKFSDQPLKLGSLNGNRFQIVLRFEFTTGKIYFQVLQNIFILGMSVPVMRILRNR